MFKYPCEGCIVDVICKDPCSKMIFFTDELKSIYFDFEHIKSQERTERLYLAIIKFAGPDSTGFDRRITLSQKLLRFYREHYKTGIFLNNEKRTSH